MNFIPKDTNINDSITQRLKTGKNDYLDDDADLTAEQYYNETFKSE